MNVFLDQANSIVLVPNRLDGLCDTMTFVPNPRRYSTQGVECRWILKRRKEEELLA